MGLSLTALLLCGCRGGDPAPNNVVLITVDTLRADHLHCYGYSRKTSPAIDRMAREGFLFEAAMAQSSWTLPSVASFLSGRHPAEIGMTRRDSRLDGKVTLAAELFRRAGFDTGAFISASYLKAERGFDQGFDVFDWFPPSRRRAADLNRRATAWLDRERSRPFFLWLHYFDPHSDYDAPAPFDRRFGTVTRHGKLGKTDQLRRVVNGDVMLTPNEVKTLTTLYDQEIAYTDHQIGLLLKHLKERRLFERTAVLVGSDHGEEFMEHGSVLHGMTLYEEQLHVPLIVRPAGGIPSPRRVTTPVQNLDILPTLLELAGVPRPPGLEGVALLHSTAGGGAPPARRLVAHTDMTGHIEVFSQLKEFNNAMLRLDTRFAVRDGARKLIISERSGGVEIYDLARDPSERANLFQEDAEDGAGLRAWLETWIRNAKASARPQTRIKLHPGEIERLRRLGYF